MDANPILRPLERSGRFFWPLVIVLAAGVALGAHAYGRQLGGGLWVTGLSHPVFWGTYILNLIFFMGISYGALLTSVVLRLSSAEWRNPIVRAGEVVAVCALLVGGVQPLLDLGRIDRIGWLVRHASFSSPMVWDVLGITTYSGLAVAYLWVSLIPDAALLRDRGVGGRLRRALYRGIACGFRGTEAQGRRWRLALRMLTLLALPAAISAAIVVSLVPGLAHKPLWRPPLMAPYFVLGAVFSGAAMVLVFLAIVRRAFGLSRVVAREHFSRLGVLVSLMALCWLALTLAEHVTAYLGREPAEVTILTDRLVGRYAPAFWAMVGCLCIPLLLLIPRLRTIAVTASISALVVVGMWLERFLILIPTQVRPRLASPTVGYWPSWVEWSVLSASVCAFVLLLVLFARFLPVVAIREAREGPSPPTP